MFGSTPRLNSHRYRFLIAGGPVALLAILTTTTAAHSQSSPTPAPVIVQPGSPGQPSRTLPPNTTGIAPPQSRADTDFMQGMIMHHSQAVEMTALIPSHTANEAVRALGRRISLSQSDEIKFMRQWLENRGESTSMPDMPGMAMPLMPGMLTPAQMAALRAARGAEFDRLFLTGMIQHHGGALVMVKDLFDSPGAGQDADVFNFATDVDNTQRAEIKIMQRMLQHPIQTPEKP
ncbi:MAG TPA: DUF305 domain-containing protein [Acidobacteriaceae bacterium]